MGVAPRGPAYFRDPNPNPNPDPNPDTHPSERDGPESRDEREQDSDVASSSVSAIVEGEARMEKQEERVVRDLGDDFKFDVMKVSDDSLLPSHIMPTQPTARGARKD